MQLCTIYKSSKKAETYLYVEKTDDFSKVPEQLMKLIGAPLLVMTLDLDRRNGLAQADLDKVKQELKENGYYLQLPPPQENLLDTFKKSQSASTGEA
ncbi:YcgL domain-containing protein [Psychrosphaera ytuae]|uniref:YcgL domain-containing protein J1N51_05025 n=1 Tax=Psychrosphaera ytuae TaxID=2820710 RepID=A0A975DCV6_9GAMM|nr:YcgL domain-containing protein [Psychrosphaera ytuae]QTH64822.1 YcgL domain-containing protein [Psychrosphaera ytuae]